MKHSVLILLILLLSLSTKAQWGVSTGLNISKSTNIDAVDYSFGIQGSIHYKAKLINNLFYKPQFIFSNERLTEKIDNGGGTSGRYNISNIDMLNIKENAFYGTLLPINISYEWDIKNLNIISFDLGIYTALGLFGQSNYEIWKGTSYWKSPSSETFSYRNRFDYGLSLGINYIHKHFIYSIQTKLGLKNIDPIEEDGYMDTYMFNIGYLF